jgi:hypothetical protein
MPPKDYHEGFNDEYEVPTFVRNQVAVEIKSRPVRDLIINEDDIINLKIALETAKSLDEFLEMV